MTVLSSGLLFDRIYEKFAADVIAKGTFLECLEPYMQSDRLTAIPPAVMKDFVDHFEMRGLLDSVEACIVHLDIQSLDIHQVHYISIECPIESKCNVDQHQANYYLNVYENKHNSL